MDWFALALEKAQRGRNPSLLELCDTADYLREMSQRNARLQMLQCIKDFVDYADRALAQAWEVEADGDLYESLQRLRDEAMKEVPHE